MRSRDIIKAVAQEHGLQPSDILGRDRFGHFIEARRETMVRLREAGFSYPQIGSILDRDHSTVVFHVNQSNRARRLNYMRNYVRHQRSMATA